MRPDDILSYYSLNSLRTIARMRSYPFAALRRPELVAALAERVFALPDLRQVLSRLADGERAVLTAVAEHGGRIARPALMRTLLEQGAIDDGGTGRPRETIDRIPPTTRRFDELCARLTAHGLLFSEPHVDGTLAGPRDLTPGDVLFVPGPVFEALQAGDRPSALPEERGRLIVQPSYTILALPPLDDPTIQRLNTLAEPVRIAEVAEFRLTQAALFEAVAHGTTVEDSIVFLEARSDAPLPQNVRYTLETWQRAFDQVRLYDSAALIESDRIELDALEADPTLAPLIIRRISSTRLLVRDAPQAFEALTARGEIPVLTRYDGARTARCSITGDGQVTLDHALNDLLLPIALRRVATATSDGHFQLMPDLVRAAVADAPDGITGLLKWLRTIAGGDLAPELVSRLYRWALPSSAVTLEQPLLLQLPADLLAELRAQPDVAALLGREYAPAGALVEVDPAFRTQLLAALHGLGINVQAASEIGHDES